MKKKYWYKIHSTVGLITGIFLLVIGLSGSLLMFANEIDELFRPEKMHLEPQAKRLADDDIYAAIKKKFSHHAIAGWLKQETPTRPDVFYLHDLSAAAENITKEFPVLINPYSGKIIAALDGYRSTFRGWMLEFHYSFFAGSFGYFMAGIFAILFCFLGISGVYLYRNFWKKFFTFRWRESTRIFFSDFHKFIGISSVLFNLLLGFTGAWWSLNATVFSDHKEPEKVVVEKFYNENLSLEKMYAYIASQFPLLQVNYIGFPHHQKGDPFIFYGAPKNQHALQSRYGSHVAFDGHTGKFLTKYLLEEQNIGRKILDSFYPLHFGNFGGLAVKILWCILGLAPAGLSISGFIVWRERRRR